MRRRAATWLVSLVFAYCFDVFAYCFDVFVVCKRDMASRKRGMTAMLADSTNVAECTPKRLSAVKSRDATAFMSHRQASRGIHTAKPVELEPPPEHEALNQLCKNKGRRYVLMKGQDLLGKYIDHNTTPNIQKATALNIFALSVLEGESVIASCNIASKYTGFSSQVIRRWASTVYCDFLER